MRPTETDQQSEFFPVSDPLDAVTWKTVPGWAIGSCDNGVDCCMSKDGNKGGFLIFGTRADADSAIRAMSEAGISTVEKMKSMPRSEVVRICCEALMW